MDQGIIPNQLKTEVHKVIISNVNYLINNSTSANGLLAKTINVTNNKIINNSHNAAELGDYAQYIAFSGKLLGKPEYIDYAINQVKVLSAMYQRKDGIIDLEPNKKLLNIGEMDLYIGMVQLFIITRSAFIKEVVDRFYLSLFEKVINGKNLVPALLTKNLRFIVPIANPMDNGNHIELLCALYEITGEKKYKIWMIQLSEIWMKNKSFNKYHLYKRSNTNLFGYIISLATDQLFKPNFLFIKLGKPSYCVKITKQNTHLMFGLLEYYSITKNGKIGEIFNSWSKKVDELFLHSSGIHYGIYDLKRKYAYRLEILHSISLIELMLTAFKVFDSLEYLSLAEKYAEALINNLTNDRLLLLYPFPEDDFHDPQRERIQAEYGYYSLDPHIDFAVCLINLYVITKRDQYLYALQAILNSTLVHFKHGNCYTEMIQKDTGLKWDVVRTKYLGLMLKPFLILLALQQGYTAESIEIRSIAQDR
jgi:hypothetical protein